MLFLLKGTVHMRFFVFWRKKFGFARDGILIAWKMEKSIRVMAIFLVMIVSVALATLSLTRVLIIAGSWMVVIIMELINSALERIIDMIQPRLHGIAKECKDMMAAAVTLAALCAIVVIVAMFVV